VLFIKSNQFAYSSWEIRTAIRVHIIYASSLLHPQTL